MYIPNSIIHTFTFGFQLIHSSIPSFRTHTDKYVAMCMMVHDKVCMRSIGDL